MRVLWLGLKWTTAAFGAFLWIMLWWSRSQWLGAIQVVIIGAVLLRELGPHLRRQ